MAHTLSVTKTMDGPSNFMIQLMFISDGYSGELVNYPVVIAANLVPPMASGADLNIQQVLYLASGTDMQFFFENKFPSVNTPIWNFTPSAGDSQMDFRPFGGLSDRQGDANSTGNLVVSSNGFASSGSKFSMIMKIRKMK